MALNRSKSFSMVFLAIMATLILLAGQAHGRRIRSRSRTAAGGICGRADYPAICSAAVKGQKNPYAATQAAIKQLISSTAAAKKWAAKGRKSQELGVCNENYDNALSSLRTSLGNMKTHDKGSFNSYVSAALTDYGTCDDAFSEIGLSSPLLKTNTRLSQMASNILYLATLWR